MSRVYLTIRKSRSDIARTDDSDHLEYVPYDIKKRDLERGEAEILDTEVSRGD